MGPDGMHSLLSDRYLLDIITRLLSIPFEKLWLAEEVPEDWKTANFIQSSKGQKRTEELLGQSDSSQSLDR